ESFVAAVNAEVRALLYRRGLNRRLRENRSVAYRQYAEFSAILGDISQELGSALGFETELEVKLRKYLRRLGIAADTAVFRDRGGRLHAELAGADLRPLRRDARWLDRLSAVVGTRLCARTSGGNTRIELLEAEPLAAEIGVSRVNKAGETVSGDQGTFFKTDEGRLYILLSDGMGSGEDAARASSDTVRILERFLRSGVAPETAVRMLNDIMLLKNEDTTSSATVDMACVNLFTGDVALYKYGAAPTYVKSDRSVESVRGRSVPLGLLHPPGDAPDVLKIKLLPGMFAVLVSDGAASGDAASDDALASLIADFDGEARELSRAIVERSRAGGPAEDDVTAIAIKLIERG
ncbi:MAG: SpoIIE family protein phosphatase, partial [Oscillospiraceae bacterium]|nr:SpoIIE family protein phosphatase [Oscillospiraceae bacterium]